MSIPAGYRAVVFVIKEEQARWLKREAKEQGTSASAIVREAILKLKIERLEEAFKKLEREEEEEAEELADAMDIASSKISSDSKEGNRA